MVRLAKVEKATSRVGSKRSTARDDRQQADLAQVVGGDAAVGVALDEVVGDVALVLDQLVAQAAIAGALVLDEQGGRLLARRHQIRVRPVPLAVGGGIDRGHDQSEGSVRCFTNRNVRPPFVTADVELVGRHRQQLPRHGMDVWGRARLPAVALDLEPVAVDPVVQRQLESGLGVLDDHGAHLVDRHAQILDVAQAEADFTGHAGRRETGDAQEARFGRDDDLDVGGHPVSRRRCGRPDR